MTLPNSEAAARGRVIVLAGGLSHERDVSIRSGRRVADALRAAGLDVEQLDADGALLTRLITDRPAVVFPTLHGAAGEDGAIRDVLELLGIPYVGARSASCRSAFDKAVAKARVRAAGLKTPEWVALPHSTFRDLGASALLDSIVAKMGLPLFVKPAQGGSALGATLVRDADDLPNAMVDCFAYGETAIVERFVDGTEVAVSVVDIGDGPIALPAIEIAPDGEAYDYNARYTAGTTQFFTPARLDPDVAKAVAEAAIQAHETLGLRDISRTDLIVDEAGVPWFLEVNVAPGLTETSLLPQEVAAAGYDLGALYRSLVEQAARRGS